MARRLRTGRRSEKSGRPHDVRDAGAEAEHQEDDHAPRGCPEPAVEEPAEASPRDHARHELRGHAEGAPEPRSVGGRPPETLSLSRRGLPLPVELRFETLEPLGKIAVGGRSASGLAPAPCVVTIHGETRVASENRSRAPPEAGRTIVSRQGGVKNSAGCSKVLIF